MDFTGGEQIQIPVVVGVEQDGAVNRPRDSGIDLPRFESSPVRVHISAQHPRSSIGKDQIGPAVAVDVPRRHTAAAAMPGQADRGTPVREAIIAPVFEHDIAPARHGQHDIDVPIKVEVAEDRADRTSGRSAEMQALRVVPEGAVAAIQEQSRRHRRAGPLLRDA